MKSFSIQSKYGLNKVVQPYRLNQKSAVIIDICLTTFSYLFTKSTI